MTLKNRTLWLFLLFLFGFFCALYYYQMFHLERMMNLQNQIAKSSESPGDLLEGDVQLLQDNPIELVSSQNQNEVVTDAAQSLAIETIEEIQDMPLSVVSDEGHQEVEQHLFKELEKKIFYTPQERKDFFANLGLEYLNATLIDYAPIFEMDPRTSDKYLSDITGNELLTNLYGVDIANQALMPMSIRWIDNRIGHGIFAENDLAEGGFVGVYGGEVRDRLLIASKDYAWAYPAETLEGGKISLDACLKGNELRFINDGQDPNCVAKYVIGLDNLWHACYIAAKDIKKGDQLLVSYGPAYWDSRKYPYQELAGVSLQNK